MVLKVLVVLSVLMLLNDSVVEKVLVAPKLLMHVNSFCF